MYNYCNLHCVVVYHGVVEVRSVPWGGGGTWCTMGWWRYVVHHGVVEVYTYVMVMVLILLYVLYIIIIIIIL